MLFELTELPKISCVLNVGAVLTPIHFAHLRVSNFAISLLNSIFFCKRCFDGMRGSNTARLFAMS